MEKYNHIKTIAFDADDTLWDCQSHFDEVSSKYASLLSSFASEEEVNNQLFRTEEANMPILGYGSKAFIISLIENAISMSHGAISADSIATIIKLGKTLQQMPATPLPGVKHVLNALHVDGRFQLVLFTKGELMEQESKLKRSGLEPYFNDVEIVCDKNIQTFERLCHRLQISPKEMLMVGNSLKSDIKPLIKLGGMGVYIPFHTTWKYEQTDAFSHSHYIQLHDISALVELFGLSS